MCGFLMNKCYVEKMVVVFNLVIEVYEDLIFGKCYIVECKCLGGEVEYIVKMLYVDS